MEIGGYDTIIKTTKASELLFEIIAFLNWPDAVVEKDEEDFFYYQNQAVKDAWDNEESIPAENTMVYFLPRSDELTIVTDKDLTDKIRLKYNNETINIS